MATPNKNVFHYLKKGPQDRTVDDKFVSKPVNFCSLFRFSTACERLSITIGTLFALIAGVGIPGINLVYGEFTNILIDRQYAEKEASVNTIILFWFGGGRVLRNATLAERMAALDEDAVAFAVSVCVFSGVSLAFLGISVFIFNVVAHLQVNRIRKILFETLLSLNMAWYDVRGPVNLASKLSEDLTNVQNGIGERLAVFIYQTSVTVLILASSFYVGWLLTLVLMGCLVPMVIVFILQNKIQSQITVNEVHSVELASQLAEEVFTGIKTVIAFCAEDKEVKRYKEKLLVLQSLGVMKGMTAGFGIGFVWLIIFSCYAVAFAFGFRLILWTPSYNPAVLITVFFAALTAATSLSYSLPYVESFATACGSAGSIFSIIGTKSDINPFSKDGISRADCSGEIEFKDVYFHYPSRPEIDVLKGFNIKIKPGERIGIVGESGSGKSTIIDLIQRFYDPVVGEVLLDGVNLKSLNVSWLRRQVSVVLQDPVLFSGTVGENIAFGVTEARDDQIIEAAIKANAHQFILELDNDYDTVLGGKRANLSGGQKQKIAIARALIRKPKILLLDEATAIFDQSSEDSLRKALHEAGTGRTTLVITHNLSTLVGMDRIIVLANGSIVEEGTHEDLKKLNGLYNRLLKTEIDNIRVTAQRQNVVKSKVDIKGQVEEGVLLVPGARGYFTDVGFTSKEEFGDKKVRDNRYLKVGLRHFLKWNKSFWYYLFLGFLSSVILGCIFPAVCILFGELVGALALLEIQTLYTVDMFSLIFVCMGLGAGIFSFIQMCCLGVASSRLNTYLRLRTFETILRQEVAWFDSVRNTVSVLCSRLNYDCSIVQGVISGRVGIIVQGCTATVCGIAISMYYSWKLTLVTCAVVPLIFTGIFLDMLSSNRQRMRELKAIEDATKIASEAINNLKIVNSLGKERFFLQRYSEILKMRHVCRYTMGGILRGFTYSLSQITSLFGYAISLWYGAYLMKTENLSYENVIRVSELVIYGCWLLGQSLAMAPNFKKASAAAGRLQYLFLRKSRIQSGRVMVPPLSGSNDTIEFSNVYFSYPTRPETIILKNIHISIRQGESVALVGPTGSGRSTVLSLLMRFYDPNVGSISIGHTKLPSYNLTTLRRSIGLVSQETVIFNRSVYENIAYGDAGREIRLEDVIQAAKAAGIHSFISSLPSGYDTRLGSSLSSGLSGGQKQKIAIARALIRNPKILLLDEATSALDPESERIVQQTLNSVMTGRTTIIVGHRPGSIANADFIYVIADGRVVEYGTHAKLMKDKGFYYRMRGGVE